MTSKYIDNSNYALTGYTLTGVFQSITIGPSALIDGRYGILGPGAEAYTIVNRGSIQGTKAGIMLDGSGTVLNGGTIVATGTSGIGVHLYSNALLVNAAGGTIEGFAGVELESGSLANSGTIDATGFVTGISAVTITAGGTVTNEKSGVIDGVYGVYITGGLGYVTNSGTIQSNSLGVSLEQGGTVTNDAGGVISGVVRLSAGTLTNGGTIAGGVETKNVVTYDAGAYIDNLQTGQVLGSGIYLLNGSLVNAGTIMCSRGGVFSSKTIPGEFTGVIRNTGTIMNKEGSGVYLNGGASVTNAGNGMISGLFAGVSNETGDGKVVNMSTISSTGYGKRSGYGVRSCGVQNLGSTSLIEGAYGILARGSILNEGTIIGTAHFGVKGGIITNSITSALITGTFFGVYDDTSLTNYGTVRASGATGVAVDLGTITNIGTTALIEGYEGIASGYLVVNGGRILATGTGGNAIGVDLVANAVAVRNNGLISGEIGVELSSYSYEHLTTVDNFGTIASTAAGGTAVLLKSKGEVLIDEAGSRFIGLVSANAGTLELAGIGGSLSGLGSTVSGFTTLDVTAGASWTFAAGDSLAGVTNFTSAGTLVNDASLTSAGYTLLSGIVSGTGALTISGNTVVKATISGSGALTITGKAIVSGNISGTGTLTLASALTLLNGNLTVSKSLVLDGELLGLIGHTLATSGAVTFGGDTIEGSGSFSTQAATNLVALTVEGDALWTNGGTVTDTGSLVQGSQGSSGSLVNAATAVFDITNNNGIGIAAGGTGTVANQGLLEKTGGTGTSTIAANLADTGRVVIASGTVDLTGVANSIAGTVSGAGALQLGAGATTLASGAVLTVADLTLSGASVTLAKNLTFNGGFVQNGGPIRVAGYTLVLNGAATLGSGTISGAGFLATYGAVSMAAYSASAGAVWQVFGTVNAAGSLTLGNGGGSGRLAVEAGGVYDITGAGSVLVAAGGSGTLADYGVLEKTGGTGVSTIAASLTDTGTVAIASGTLDFTGAANSFAGTVSGAGTLQFGGGTSTLAAGAVLTVAHAVVSGGTVALGAKVTDAGGFTESGGTIVVSGYSLTLAGSAAFTGGAISGAGFVGIYGKSTLSGLTVAGGAVFQDFTALVDSGSIVLGDASGGSGRLVIESGDSLNITENGGVSIASGGAGSFVNVGLLEKTAGTGISTIAVALNNAGEIEADSGALDLAGAVGGTGSATIGSAGALRFDGSVAATQTISFAGTAGGRLALNDPSGSGLGFAGLVKGFGGKDQLDLTTFAYSGTPTIGWSQTSASSGTLTVTDGTKVAKITLFGQFSQAGFGKTKDGGSGTDIIYTTPAQIAALGVPHH